MERHVRYFSLLQLLLNHSFWRQMPRPLICWHYFMSRSIKKNCDEKREKKRKGTVGMSWGSLGIFKRRGEVMTLLQKVHHPGRRLVSTVWQVGCVCEGDPNTWWQWLLRFSASRGLISIHPHSACSRWGLDAGVTWWEMPGLPLKKKWLEPGDRVFLTQRRGLTRTPRNASGWCFVSLLYGSQPSSLPF